MEATFLITITIFLFACSPKEPSTYKLLDDYIKLNVDNPNTYESVETRPAEFSDLFENPEISGQFDNVDEVAAQISFSIDDIYEYLHLYLSDSIREQMVEIKKTFNGNDKISFKSLDVYVDKVSGLLFDSITLPNSIPSYNRQLFLEYTAQYEGSRNRLMNDYSRLYSIIQSKIGIGDYSELVSAIEADNLVLHKYRIEENGSLRLKGDIFLMKDLKVIRSMSIEIDKL